MSKFGHKDALNDAGRALTLLQGYDKAASSGSYQSLLRNWAIVHHKDGGGGVDFYSGDDTGLAAAVAAVANGSVVEVCPGTYSGNYTFPANTEFVGVGDTVELAGTITNNGAISHMTISGTLTNNGTLNDIIDSNGYTQMTGRLGVGISPRCLFHIDDSTHNLLRVSSPSNMDSTLQLYGRSGTDYWGWALVKNRNTSDFEIHQDTDESAENRQDMRIAYATGKFLFGYEADADFTFRGPVYVEPTTHGSPTSARLYLDGDSTQYKGIYLRDTTSGEEWAISHRPDSEGNRLETWHYDGASWHRYIAVDIDGDIIFGDGTAGKDFTFTVDGETNDGVFAWMEDEDYWESSDAWFINTGDATNVGLTIKAAVSQSAFLQEWRNSTGTVLSGIDERGNFVCNLGSPSTNLFIGEDVGVGSATGTSNVGVGRLIFTQLTSGSNNFCFGSAAGRYLTSGSSNLFFGNFTGNGVTTSSYSCVIGNYGLYSATTGTVTGNVGLGTSVFYYLTSGSYNIAIGQNAGRYYGGGFSHLTTIDGCIYIGREAQASADSVTNEIVIGYYAVGKGSNTATIGATSITDTYLRGHLHIGQGAAGVDYTLTFDGETNDGVFAWMEDEDYFDFADKIKASGGLRSSNDNDGITTTFTNGDGDTVTVENGLIVDIS